MGAECAYQLCAPVDLRRPDWMLWSRNILVIPGRLNVSWCKVEENVRRRVTDVHVLLQVIKRGWLYVLLACDSGPGGWR